MSLVICNDSNKVLTGTIGHEGIVNGGDDVVLIDRKEVPLKKVTLEHARTVATVGADENEVRNVYLRIVALKKSIVDYGRSHLQRLLLHHAKNVVQMQVDDKHRCGGKRVVAKYEEIGRSWQEDGSIQNAEKIFQVLYRPFDNDPNMTRKIAFDYMLQHNISYKSNYMLTARENDGCIAVVIGDVRRELIKTIMGRAKHTHGYRVTITREKCDIERNKRRVPGVFYEWFRKGNENQMKNICFDIADDLVAHHHQGDDDEETFFEENMQKKKPDDVHDTKPPAITILTLANKELKQQMEKLSETMKYEEEKREIEERRKLIDEGVKASKKRRADEEKTKKKEDTLKKKEMKKREAENKKKQKEEEKKKKSAEKEREKKRKAMSTKASKKKRR